MLSSLTWVFATSACLFFATGSPVNTHSSIAKLETRNTSSCTDLRADRSTVCWDELDIPGYLAGWNQTTPTCQAGDDGSNCCQAQEPWTTCFLRLAYGSTGSDCTSIKSQSCSLNQLSPNLDPSIAPKAEYVVWNIVTINDFFVSYYAALQSQGNKVAGTASESFILGQILKGSPQAGATLNNGNVAKALVAGLPFWGTSTVFAGGPQQINPNVNPAAAQEFAQSLQNTATVRSMLLDTPYNQNDYMTTESQLANNLNQAQNLLQSALSLIMSDVPSFSSWASHGLYSSSNNAVTVPQVATGLTSAFTTYLIGEALSQSQFSATPSSTTISKAAFQNSRTCTTLGDVCKDSSGKAYYWSQAFQTQYEINEPGNWAEGSSGSQTTAIQELGYEASAYSLLEQIETSDAYMPVLFDGAYNCTLEGKAGGSAININADGSLDVACLSSLPIYLSKGSSCPAGAVQVRGKCPFGFNG